MAHPTRTQEDYSAVKNGIVRDLFSRDNSRKERKEYSAKINREVIIPDDQLRKYVDGIIREDLRFSSYNTLIKAKNSPTAIRAYYNFVNAYQMFEKDDSYGNTCCMAIDRAEELLKQARAKKKKGRKRNFR